MIQLGDALLKLSVDSTALEEGLKNVEKRCTDLGKKMMLVGTAIVGSLVGATIASAKLGDEIYEMSKRTGIGTVALSELRYMADVSGTSLEGLEVGIKRMQMVLKDAFSGAPAATKAIEDLGLSIEDLKKMSPEEQFYALGTAISQIEDPTIRAAVATEIFGRSGTDLLPMLAGGAEGIAKMKEEAHEYGRIVSEEAAKKSDAFNDSLTNLKESFGKILDAIAIDLMPIMTDWMNNYIVPAITKVADWIKNNDDLVKGIGILAGVILVGGGILYAISMVAKTIVAVNAALIIMQSLSGPAGWAMLAAGIGIAVATIVGMNKLMGSLSGPEIPTEYGPYSEAPKPGEGGEVGGFKYSAQSEGTPTTAEPQVYKPGPYGPVPIDEPWPEWYTPPDWYKPPEMQYGGTVPGPKGRPVPIIAHGGEEFLGVQNINRAPAGNTIMNVGLLPGDDVTLRKLARVLKDVMGEDTRRNAFGQVNRGYFYGRSSL